MHQQGSFVSPLLRDVICQCRPDESFISDPGGGPDVGPSNTFSASKADPHHCSVCGLPEQEHRLKVLFQILDVNRDGGICVNDLIIGLKKLGLHRTEHELRVRNTGRCYDVTIFILHVATGNLASSVCLACVSLEFLGETGPPRCIYA